LSYINCDRMIAHTTGMNHLKIVHKVAHCVSTAAVTR